jgi:hypothetical protein
MSWNEETLRVRFEVSDIRSQKIAHLVSSGPDWSWRSVVAGRCDALRTNEKERKVEPPCALLAHGPN